MILEKNFKYIDLFSGIGGFHCAMDKYSDGLAKCILASEINEDAKRTYEKYFKMNVHGDITKIDPSEIKENFDVCCGGFPCQTFSKAGMQKGFGDPRGTLFKEIIRLIENDDIKKQPKFLILENVRNLITHDNGITWNTIKKALQDSKYNVISTPIIVGPKDFGIPQLRDRAIILAVRKDIYDGTIDFTIPRRSSNTTNINLIIDNNLTTEEEKKYKISTHEEKVLSCWNEFLGLIQYVPVLRKRNTKEKYEKKLFSGVIGFPIWAFEFNKNYDLNSPDLMYQDWKKEFIEKNRMLYEYNKPKINKWLKKWNYLEDFTHTEQKFEWQCGPNYKSLWDGIIQFRPSGIRVKQPTEFPTLVAMVHKPIIGKYKRYITIREAARLQSFPEDYDFSQESSFNAYKQLGNAVNVDVIYNTFKLFIEYIEKKVKEEK